MYFYVNGGAYSRMETHIDLNYLHEPLKSRELASIADSYKKNQKKVKQYEYFLAVEVYVTINVVSWKL